MADILQTKILIAFTFKESVFFIFIQISPKFVSKSQTDSIGSGNGLVQERQQAIAWTDVDLVYRCMCVSPIFNVLSAVRSYGTHLIHLSISEEMPKISIIKITTKNMTKMQSCIVAIEFEIITP